MKIFMQTLSEGEQHPCGYETCGDWQVFEPCRIEVTVNKMADPDSEFVVMLHELVEAYLCRKRGITSEEVGNFDRLFEEERAQGKHDNMAEPGDDPRAPYLHQHQAATVIEMLVFHMLGGHWVSHCKGIADG